jgi:hypothetical protein
VDDDQYRHTLDGRQAKLLGNLGVLNAAGLLECHATDELSQVAAAGNGRATAESLELDVRDGVVVGVDLDLQLHHIAAGRGADETGADVVVALAHAADIARVVVVVQDLLVVRSLADGLLD